MATQYRDFSPGVHHIWIGATGGEAYFRDAVDRMTWIRGLVMTAARYGWTCVCFCQMTTHAHLILNVPDRSLPAGMQRMNCDYGRRFNIRHDRTGQLVRRRYGNRRIHNSADLLGAFAYVVLNPARAGLCLSPEDWRWSSLASTLSIADDFPFVDAALVLAEFDNSNDRLRNFVEARRRSYVSEKATSGRQTTGRGSNGRAYAITSTRDSPDVPSRSSTSRRARMETSS